MFNFEVYAYLFKIYEGDILKLTRESFHGFQNYADHIRHGLFDRAWR